MIVGFNIMQLKVTFFAKRNCLNLNVGKYFIYKLPISVLDSFPSYKVLIIYEKTEDHLT